MSVHGVVRYLLTCSWPLSPQKRIYQTSRPLARPVYKGERGVPGASEAKECPVATARRIVIPLSPYLLEVSSPRW
jgi:hypothetical protein